MTIVSEEKFSHVVKVAPSTGSDNGSGDGFQESASQHGISVTVAALFLLGCVAGAGIVAMPNAFLKAGWWAVPMIIVMCAIGCLTGMQLGWSWTILQKTWPEYSSHTRNPYPEIAYRAGGNFMKYCVQFSVNSSMFGGGVAFLILSSQNISHLLADWFDMEVNFCFMICIIGAAMLPLSYLGTPKDFWPIALGAIAATLIAIIVIMIGTWFDMNACRGKVSYPGIEVKGFISAYCTICFAYGGHAAFPTVQHDMKKPSKFPISVVMAFIALFIMYFPMPVMSYMVYGHTVQGTIESNLSSKWVKDIIMVLITGHVLFAYFIVMSPVTQDFERIMKIPVEFSWKRVCTRTFMLGMSVFVGLSLPDFNAVLELVGGTTLAATAYIFPGPFYLALRSKTAKNAQQSIQLESNEKFPKNVNNSDAIAYTSVSSKEHGISLWEYVANGVVMCSGIVGAVITVYGVVAAGASLKKPCYMTGMHIDHSVGSAANFTHCWQSASMNESSSFAFSS